ncbi:hypothetical protein BC826DRAFT_649702 [Russula brevipes]|nr:hypothetical protein BC826DRAFT_649702 [Russula brevipes]
MKGSVHYTCHPNFNLTTPDPSPQYPQSRFLTPSLSPFPFQADNRVLYKRAYAEKGQVRIMQQHVSISCARNHDGTTVLQTAQPPLRTIPDTSSFFFPGFSLPTYCTFVMQDPMPKPMPLGRIRVRA